MMGLALFACLLVSCHILVTNYLRRRFLEAAFLASVLACAEGVLVTLGFGSIGKLTPGFVGGFTFALALLQGLVALSFQKEEPVPTGRILRNAVFPPVFWPAAAALAAALYFRLYLAWKTPPDSWDGLSYHLPIVFRWIRQGDFSLAGWPTFHRYLAHNGELLSAWLSLMDGGRLETSKLGQVLVLPLMAASAAVLGRRLAGSRWAVPCGLGSLAVPLALIQAGIPYVDLVYGACFLGTAAAAVLFDRTGRIEYLVAFALGFGMTLGSKSTAYLQAPLPLLPLWTFLARPDTRWKAALSFIPLCLLVLALGGSSYLHNWWDHDNPVFPFDFRVGSWTVFHGPMAPSDLLVGVEKWFVAAPLHWIWYPFRETFKGLVVYGTEHGFGPLFAAAWAVLPLAGWSAWRSRNRAAIWLVLLAPMTLAAFFLFQPTREPRYIMFLPGLLIVSAAFALRHNRRRLGAAVRLVWSAAVVYACVACVGWFGKEEDYRSAWTWLRPRGGISAVEFYKARFTSLGEAWADLDARLEKGDVVAINYSELMLPWAGLPPRAEVHVIGHQAGLLPEGYYGELPQEWVNLLESLRVKYLGLWEPKWYPGYDSVERGFIKSFPDRFRLLGEWDGSMGKIALFELLPKKEQ
ncbi:MAG: hypothetical protein HZB91_08570 [Elusimicrobia bacterium]|nr:hypothetical protein [Elusimicrobiota bacterium]